ncbi:unnamed protein product [Ilex paraguariensis]|uniref:Uncharacterized protein n=1 Tax=Ilex paraguariensis TaxID=185542 RepID=A0ABC8RY53_9AQUA
MLSFVSLSHWTAAEGPENAQVSSLAPAIETVASDLTNTILTPAPIFELASVPAPALALVSQDDTLAVDSFYARIDELFGEIGGGISGERNSRCIDAEDTCHSRDAANASSGKGHLSLTDVTKVTGPEVLPFCDFNFLVENLPSGVFPILDAPSLGDFLG